MNDAEFSSVDDVLQQMLPALEGLAAKVQASMQTQGWVVQDPFFELNALDLAYLCPVGSTAEQAEDSTLMVGVGLLRAEGMLTNTFSLAVGLNYLDTQDPLYLRRFYNISVETRNLTSAQTLATLFKSLEQAAQAFSTEEISQEMSARMVH